MIDFGILEELDANNLKNVQRDTRKSGPIIF